MRTAALACGAVWIALIASTGHPSLTLAVGRAAEPADNAAAENWGQWRGPLSTGVAPSADPPIEWNEAEGTGIRWKTPIPGRGLSTPVVWGDRVFLTTAIPFGEALPPRPSRAPGNHDNLPVTHRHMFVALAVDRASGKIVWQKTLREALPHEQGHHTASLASNSPATDGEHVFAFFGSFGLYCLDLNGKLIWEADFGPMQSLHGHGEGSSPALYIETRWSSTGTTRENRSSWRSTNGPASKSGSSSATR